MREEVNGCQVKVLSRTCQVVVGPLLGQVVGYQFSAAESSPGGCHGAGWMLSDWIVIRQVPRAAKVSSWQGRVSQVGFGGNVYNFWRYLCEGRFLISRKFDGEITRQVSALSKAVSCRF